MTGPEISAGALRRFPAAATLPVRRACGLRRRRTTHRLALTDETPPRALHIENQGAADALRTVYGPRFAAGDSVGPDQPQPQLLSGAPAPTVEVDRDERLLRITGDPIPYTLMKQGIRWTAAATLPAGWLPPHAVVIRFGSARLAIVGRGRAGKSHLARLLLARAEGRILFDGWALTDTAVRRPRWPGDLMLHIRGTDLATAAGQESAVAFELTDDDPGHHESRYLVRRDQEAAMALPSSGDGLTHLVFIGNSDGPQRFHEDLAARECEHRLREHLWDDPLSMLPEQAAQRLDADWSRLLDGVRVAFVEGHRGSPQSTLDAVEKICAWGDLT